MIKKTVLRFAALALAVVGFAVIAGQPASANTFQSWRFKDASVICVNDHGSTQWPVATAVAEWDASPYVTVVRSADCAAYPTTQRITIETYDDASNYACAKTASSTGYDWQYVYYPDGTRKAVWTPRTMTIWLNTASAYYGQCHATAEQRAHVIAHEIGHALGLGHPDEAGDVNSVMQDWAVQGPTDWDLANIAKLYGNVTTAPTRTAMPVSVRPMKHR